MMSNFTGESAVFLLGAGFSKSIDLDMPLMGELAKRLEFGAGSAAKPYCDQTFEDDFEAWLSSLASVCPWVDKQEQTKRKEAFFEVLKAIQFGLIPLTKEVIDRFSFLAQDSAPWHYLFELIEYWHVNQSTVITLNYDTIVECIAKYYLFNSHGKQAVEFDFYPQTVSPLESFRIYKLHGSINLWSKDPLKGNSLEQVETSDQNSRTKLINEGYMPYIIPPLSVKDPYYVNNTVKCNWAQALTKISEARRLVVMGFSFPSSDWIMKSFLRNLNKEAAVDVVDVSTTAVLNAASIFAPEGRQVNAFIHKSSPIEKYLETRL